MKVASRDVTDIMLVKKKIKQLLKHTSAAMRVFFTGASKVAKWGSSKEVW